MHKQTNKNIRIFQLNLVRNRKQNIVTNTIKTYIWNIILKVVPINITLVSIVLNHYNIAQMCGMSASRPIIKERHGINRWVNRLKQDSLCIQKIKRVTSIAAWDQLVYGTRSRQTSSTNTIITYQLLHVC